MVLVTGATGLVGSHLVLHLLEQNESVKAIYRNEETISKTKAVFSLYKKEILFKKIEWIQADITDVPTLEMAFQDVEFVYHCAAFISFDPKEENQLRKINIEGTANIVNFCIEYNIKKLCYVSSIAALGDLAINEITISETTEWNPEKAHSDYAISKYGAEIEVWRGQQEGLNVVIINPGVILGPCLWETGSSEIFIKVKKGLLFYTKGLTGFIAVTDVVKLMFQLMKSNITGERYIAIAEAMTFETVLKTIAKALQVKPPIFYAKPWLTEIAWRIDWVLATFFIQKRKLSKSMAQSLHNTDVISNKKIRTTLDYKFLDIDDCILEIGKSYFKN